MRLVIDYHVFTFVYYDAKTQQVKGRCVKERVRERESERN